MVISKGARIAGILAILFIGCSYRLYLARFHTEVGIDGMAGWWTVVTNNADSLDHGQELATGELYAPGQSWTVYALYRFLPRDPAVLRICFGLLDGAAILFVVLLGKELVSWSTGLLAGLAYALWPEGASASVNILHDHSPQPLFLFIGLWLVLCWFQRRRPLLLISGGLFLGLPTLYRADAVILTLAVPLGILLGLLVSGARPKNALAWAALAAGAILAPTVPYDVRLWQKAGSFKHVAAGDVGSVIFMRYGRSSGYAGSRWNDSEVQFLTGVDQPFGSGWYGSKRFRPSARFGMKLFWQDPLRYLRLVVDESRENLAARAGYRLWLDPSQISVRDLTLASRLDDPDLCLAIPVAKSRLQLALADPRWLLALGVVGAVVGSLRNRAGSLLLAVVASIWIGFQLFLLPNARYLLMPSCVLFPLAATALGAPLSWLTRARRSDRPVASFDAASS